MKFKIWKFKLFIFSISVLIYIASLFLPALTQEEIINTSSQSPQKTYSMIKGYHLFFFGFLGFWIPPFLNTLSWLSNFFIIFSWIKIPYNSNQAIYLSLVALLLAPVFLIESNLPVIIFKDDASGGNVTTLHIGFWCWILSIVIFFLGSCIVYCLEHLEIKFPDKE